MGRDLTVDLGTQNTVVFAEGSEVVLVEPTVAAVERGRGRMTAAGGDALRALRDSPDELEAVWPVKDGAVADFGVAEGFLSRLLRKVRRQVYGRFLRPPVRPRALLCVPAGATDLELDTIKRVAMSAGARGVRTIEAPLAAAVGAGLAVEEPEGTMVVDIGCGKTEAAVMCLGSIVAGCSARTGVGAMDASIRAYLSRAHDLSVDLREAERIKVEAGCALPPVRHETAEVGGRDLATGRPKKILVDKAEVHRAMKGNVDAVVEVVRRALENTSAELVTDVAERGIVLTGGGAQLRMLDDLLHYKLGVPVVVARRPVECAAVGAREFLGREAVHNDDTLLG